MVAFAAKAKLVQSVIYKDQRYDAACVVHSVSCLLHCLTSMQTCCFNVIKLTISSDSGSFATQQKAALYDALLQLPTGPELTADVSVSASHCSCLIWHGMLS